MCPVWWVSANYVIVFCVLCVCVCRSSPPPPPLHLVGFITSVITGSLSDGDPSGFGASVGQTPWKLIFRHKFCTSLREDRIVIQYYKTLYTPPAYY
ncbi:filamin-A X3 [Biomphalaria glabrata]|nr:filamin-A X3 [Biomphalaria glabrata]